MTSEELQAIRERVNKATPATWIADSDSVGAYVLCIEHGHYGSVALELSDDDAAFIAHAREDVPKLLGKVERWQETVKRLDEIACSRLEEIEQLRAALAKISGYDVGTFEDDWSDMHNIASEALAGEST